MDNEDINEFMSAVGQLPYSPEEPCAYFGDRPSRYRGFQVETPLPEPVSERLFASGFRRCGTAWYQTGCARCRQCISYRIPVSGFRPTRSLRRVWRRNDDIHCTFTAPQSSPEKELMYLSYQRSQHTAAASRQTDEDLLQSMEVQMYSNPSASRELELRDGSGRLVAFGIIDVAADSASAVYIVFDPESKHRSPGTLAILHGISWAQEQGFRYFYLGFYIPAHPKMEYKSHFGPAQILDRDSGEWVLFDDSAR